VKALEGMGWLMQLQGDHERARTTYEEMLKLSRELADKGNIATALNSLGTVAVQHGDNERAKTLLQENLEVIKDLEAERDPATTLKKFYVFNLLGYLAINDEGDYVRGTTLWEQSLALAKEVGDNYQVGNTLTNLGHPALMQGDYERAKALSEEALEFARELGIVNSGFATSAFINLGLASLGLGEHERAMGSFQEALMISQNIGVKPQVIETVEGIASLAGALGEDTRAAHLWGAAEAAREVTGIALSPGERALHEPYLSSARSRLGEKVWKVTLAEGRTMSLEQAAEYALSEKTSPPTVPVPERPLVGESINKLTRREEDVAALVALGLTNREISTKLSISERTAGNHVASILKKLRLRSRTQIAIWATEHNLLTPPHTY
jgi:DNA-binding CsgD family transcriptional regulator